MGPVLAGGATPSGEQSSPAQEWVTPLHVPRELSTGGTWECTGVWLSPAFNIVQSTTLAPHTTLQCIQACQSIIPIT